MPQDWTGNSNSIYKSLGASNHSEKDRVEDDFYATSPKAVDELVKYAELEIPNRVWEPSCGSGCLSERLIEYGHEVVSTDLIARGYGVGGGKFLYKIRDAGRLRGYHHQSALQVCYRVCTARPGVTSGGWTAVPVPEDDLCRGKKKVEGYFQHLSTYVCPAMCGAYHLRAQRQLRRRERLCRQLCLVGMEEGVARPYHSRLDKSSLNK